MTLFQTDIYDLLQKVRINNQLATDLHSETKKANASLIYILNEQEISDVNRYGFVSLLFMFDKMSCKHCLNAKILDFDVETGNYIVVYQYRLTL